MESTFFDSVTIRIVAGLLFTVLIAAIYYAFDIHQFFARTDFGNVNAYIVRFSRHEKDATENKVVFEQIGYKIPLREICRNRFVFWLIIYHASRVPVEHPVLHFGRYKHVLAPVRGRLSSIWASMVTKRMVGMPYTELLCQLSLVRDRSEDSTNSVLRIMLLPQRDIDAFDEYERKPPTNSTNFRLVGQIVRAYRTKTGSFTDIRATVA